MKTHLLTVSGLLSLGAVASATMITGINFSNYPFSGVNAIDPTGAIPVQVIPALLSDLDPNAPQGCASEASGSIRYDGLFGSTNHDPSDPNVNSYDGSLGSNLPIDRDPAPILPLPFANGNYPITCAGVTPGLAQFSIGVTPAIQPFSFVVTSTPVNYGKAAEDWEITLAAGVLPIPGFGAGSLVVVEFSPDGSTYTEIGSFTVFAPDVAATFVVGDTPDLDELLGTAYFRITIEAAFGQTALILLDNIAVSGTVSDFTGPSCEAPDLVDIEVAEGTNPGEVDVILAFASQDGVTYDILGGATPDTVAKVGVVVGTGSTVTFEDTIASGDRYFYQVACPE